MKPILVLDFDSTFIAGETLDLLAACALQGNLQKEKILKEVQQITNLGMDGKLGFDESLERRLQLFSLNKDMIDTVVKELHQKVSESIQTHKKQIQKLSDSIYIVSGGFEECIVPVCSEYGISASHIFANNFILNNKHEVVGIDKNNPLSLPDGKVRVLQKLEQGRPIWMVGDGATDYAVFAAGVAQKFFYYAENVFRKDIANKAETVVYDFGEVLAELQKIERE